LELADLSANQPQGVRSKLSLANERDPLDGSGCPEKSGPVADDSFERSSEKGWNELGNRIWRRLVNIVGLISLEFRRIVQAGSEGEKEASGQKENGRGKPAASLFRLPKKSIY